ASEIRDDGDDADRPAHDSRDDVHEFEGGNRVRKDDDEGDRKEHRRGPDRPHLGRLARPNPKTCPDDEKRRPEGHHELLAEDRYNPESQDDDEQHSEQPSGRAERPRVVQERQERQQHGADDEQRGEQIDELDFRRGRDPGSLRRNDPGQGSRRFPRMRGTDWPPTRTTLGFPPSVSTLTSMRLPSWT